MMKGINHLRMMIVKSGPFPYGRQAACCPKKVKAGESIVIVNVKAGVLVVPTIFHQTCLSEIVNKMPLGKKETCSEFAKMKEQIQRTGMLFPDEEDPDGTRRREDLRIA